jgi:HEAT repeat protein
LTFAWVLTGPVSAIGEELSVDAEIAATDGDAEARKQLEMRSVGVLKTEVPVEQRDRACRILRVIGTTDSIGALSALLPEEELSHMARYALEPMPYPEAGKALREALPKTRAATKVGIIHSLGVRADKEAVPLLIPLLIDHDQGIAGAAAWALGRAGTAEAANALAKFRDDAPAELRVAAMEASLVAAEQLLRQGRREHAADIYKELRAAEAPEHVQVGAFVGLLAAQPDKALPRLQKAISGADPVLRGAAIAGIADIEQEQVVAHFAAQLPTYPAETQVLLIGALAGRGGMTVRPAITGAASSSGPEVRTAAVKALGEIGDVSSVEVLARALTEGKTLEEKQAAAASLRRLTAEGVDSAIIMHMKAASSDTRPALIDVLRDRHAAGATPALFREATNENKSVRKAAFKALGRLAEPKDLPGLVELLLQEADSSVRTEAEQAVAAVSRKVEDEASRADAALAAFDAATTTAVRCSLIRVLQGIASAKALEAVQTALTDGDPQVQDATVRALADWPNPQAIDTVADIFRTTDSETHRVLALRGCTRLLGLGGQAAPRSLKLCKELMKGAQRGEEKKLVLACLANVADPEALQVVEPHLADSEVRVEAELAALSIARSTMDSSPEKAKSMAKRLLDESESESVRDDAAKIIRKIDKAEN